jgi:hypothetical protein
MARPPVLPSSDANWGLAELIDLEAQLFADRSCSERELVARDAAIGSALRSEGRARNALLAGWVSAMRKGPDTPLPGSLVANAWGQARWVLSTVLFLIGMGAAAAVLRFTGDHPINVLVVLGVFVLAQLATLALTLLFFGVSAWAPGLFESLPLVVLARAAVRSLWRRFGAALRGRSTEGLGWIWGRRSLYAEVERNLLFALLQLGAVAFNLGVVSSCLIAVAFSDLAFGWGSTLSIGAEQLHQLCTTLSAPWASWFDEATVSAELVRLTQYSRLEGSYLQAAGGTGRALSMYGQWWRFLVASIVAYGLLPRAVLLVASKVTLKRRFAQLPPETPEVERLLMRLTAPVLHTVHGEDPGNTSPLGEGFDAVAEPPERFDQSTALCARWRDAVFEPAALAVFLRQRHGLEIEGELGSAGGHDYNADQLLLTRLESHQLPVFLVAEPWGYPDRSFQRFIAEVRAHGARRLVNVVLTEGGSPEDASIWRGYLSEMADPYLALDRVRMSTEARAS